MDRHWRPTGKTSANSRGFRAALTATHIRPGIGHHGFFGGLWFVFSVLFPHLLPRLLEIAVPLSGSDWATDFVNSVANGMGALRAHLL